MNIERPKNTKKSGYIEFFAYQERDKFIGVCLTFDIIEEGKNIEEVMKSLNEAALLHLKVVQEKNLSDDLLNRHAPEEYWSKYFELLEQLQHIQHARLREKWQTAINSFPYNNLQTNAART